MNDFLNMFNDPHARHAMMVHWPIVLCVLGPAAVLATIIAGRKNLAVKVLVVLVFVGASIGAKMAASAGGEAAGGVQAFGVSPAEDAALYDHKQLGRGGWKWPLIPGALIALTLIPVRLPFARIALVSLALLSSIGVAAWVSITAHEGGELVYRYGLGVPERGKVDAQQQGQEQPEK